MSWIGFVVALFLGLMASPSRAQDPTVSAGKQRAAASRLEWDVREAGHPALGNIRFAVVKNPVETPVGNAKVFSRAYVSCQKSSGKLAIELSNTTAPADAGGLRPAAMPRLVCNRLDGGQKLVHEALLANWEVSDIGDALTRGFRPFPLRECVSIGVEQEVELPAGWGPKTARVEFEIAPYNRELDSVFATCGERSAYAADAPRAPAATIKPAAPMPKGEPPPRPADAAAWRAARAVSSGKTNVRAAPTLQSPVVIQLDPGAVLLVQPTGGEWLRVKPSRGAAFEGYIRQDRLAPQ